ncbi:hypothetical protein [Streptomyces sp. NPDC001658]
MQPPERQADGSTLPSPARTGTPPAAPSATPTPSPGTPSVVTGITNLLGSLLGDDNEQQSAAPDASPSPSAGTPTPAPTPTDTASDAPRPPAAHASPAPGRRTAEPSPPAPAPETARKAARACDISDLDAPEDTSAGRFPDEPWNMKGSRLALHDVVFHGVVTVETTAGPQRVLKFSASAVTIRDLRMSVPVGPEIQHIDGGPGSTSTLRGDGDITMYVESLTGTLSGVENIPTPPLLRLHLTPDTVPEWLYDTVGKLGLKLQLSLNDADIDQAGQTGGRLVIPGIHGYGTPR